MMPMTTRSIRLFPKPRPVVTFSIPNDKDQALAGAARCAELSVSDFMTFGWFEIHAGVGSDFLRATALSLLDSAIDCRFLGWDPGKYKIIDRAWLYRAHRLARANPWLGISNLIALRNKKFTEHYRRYVEILRHGGKLAGGLLDPATGIYHPPLYATGSELDKRVADSLEARGPDLWPCGH